MKKSKVFVVTVSLIASLGGLLFGFDTAVISGAEKTIQELFNLTPFMHGFTISIALIGTLIGALISGKPADIFGRKKSLLAIAFLYGISAVGSALAQNWEGFLIYRFIGGLGVGASSVIGPMYIAEIAPPNIRGRLVASFQLNIVTGIVLSYFSNYWISKLIVVDSWRWMLGVLAVPSLIFLVLAFFIPDSPRWLVIKNRTDEALKLLRRLGSADPDKELAEIIDSVKSFTNIAHDKFFTSTNRYPIMLAILVAVFNQLSGINAVMYYAPRIFEMVGYGKESALFQSVSVGLALFTFTLVGMALIDKIGRKKLLLIGAVGMTVTLGLVANTIFTTSDGSIWMLINLVGFIAFFAFTEGTVIWVFISEIFPNNVRAKGQTLGSVTHWVTCVIISWGFPVVAQSSNFGGGMAFSFFSVSMIAMFFVVWKFFPETKGKSLEEIQKEFIKNNAN